MNNLAFGCELTGPAAYIYQIATGDDAQPGAAYAVGNPQLVLGLSPNGRTRVDLSKEGVGQYGLGRELFNLVGGTGQTRLQDVNVALKIPRDRTGEDTAEVPVRELLRELFRGLRHQCQQVAQDRFITLGLAVPALIPPRNLRLLEQAALLAGWRRVTLLHSLEAAIINRLVYAPNSLNRSGAKAGRGAAQTGVVVGLQLDEEMATVGVWEVATDSATNGFHRSLSLRQWGVVPIVPTDRKDSSAKLQASLLEWLKALAALYRLRPEGVRAILITGEDHQGCEALENTLRNSSVYQELLAGAVPVLRYRPEAEDNWAACGAGWLAARLGDAQAPLTCSIARGPWVGLTSKGRLFAPAAHFLEDPGVCSEVLLRRSEGDGHLGLVVQEAAVDKQLRELQDWELPLAPTDGLVRLRIDQAAAASRQVRVSAAADGAEVSTTVEWQ